MDQILHTLVTTEDAKAEMSMIASSANAIILKRVLNSPLLPHQSLRFSLSLPEIRNDGFLHLDLDEAVIRAERCLQKKIRLS